VLLLLKILKVATLTHRTVVALSATVVITAATIDYIRKRK